MLFLSIFSTHCRPFLLQLLGVSLLQSLGLFFFFLFIFGHNENEQMLENMGFIYIFSKNRFFRNLFTNKDAPKEEWQITWTKVPNGGSRERPSGGQKEETRMPTSRTKYASWPSNFQPRNERFIERNLEGRGLLLSYFWSHLFSVFVLGLCFRGELRNLCQGQKPQNPSLSRIIFPATVVIAWFGFCGAKVGGFLFFFVCYWCFFPPQTNYQSPNKEEEVLRLVVPDLSYCQIPYR